MKNKTKSKHNTNIVYHGTCHETDCPENYIGETAQGILERVKDHTGKDIHSHLFKHTVESGNELFDVTNYSITGKGYQNNIKRCYIANVLLIKEIKPTVTWKKESIVLNHFN